MALKACSSSNLRECSAQKEAKDVISERDRISELPDEILVIILSSLQTRDSVGTSTLSKRWRNVWTSVPIIEINSSSLLNEYRFKFSLFDNWLSNFVDRFILNYEICCARKLLLCSSTDYGLSKLIEVVTRVDNLEEVDLKFRGNKCVELPSSTFTCKNLVILKLCGYMVLNLPPSVCLPSLKRLHLDAVHVLDFDSSMKKFLTGSPVLEKLNIERCTTNTSDKMERYATLHIQSSSLKSLTFYSGCFLKMVIDATNLERLVLMVRAEDKFCVTSCLTSLVSVDLGVSKTTYSSSFRAPIRPHWQSSFKLLMKMSHTKYLYLSAEVMESLQRRGLNHLPMLRNLTHCEVDICRCSWRILSCLLESSPNLISFVCNKKLMECYQPQRKFRRPKCLMLCLEEIKLITLEGGDEYPMEVVSYFLENAPALKKMFIIIAEYLNPEVVLSDLYGEVLKLPKASTACEIYVRNN